ncbi:alpha/beta-hydrolase [Bimuria novae-zelandiae CBS 107.79]|uniref:Alpha/beta-hydrolase n=1 Tax=Bimuria novae-zelandiae CBS 107.79 TaxID=1447943 RepID=A0A6A5V1I9_9PLEO|nr:alpha/beta-hydrolase [Bimuria novae-zelandiae CBS 107.79]
MAKPTNLLNAAEAFPLWDDEPIDDAFTLSESNDNLDHAVVTTVSRPWLFGFPSGTASNGRAILVLGGGGYVELMVGREGIAVAKWLSTLGFHAFVLVHRFPNTLSSPQAPLDDARRALNIIQEKGFAAQGLGVCGLSSGGHLAASLLAAYPSSWTSPASSVDVPKIDFAIIGYAPISTNAKGRTIVPDKAPLVPPEKQELYDTLQPDVQLRDDVPPTFIVYAGSDPVVPVVNAYRLAEGLGKKGAQVELHVFAEAPHGFALDTVELPVSAWTGLCEAWMRQRGILG